ncbi:DUF2695 domain-containing protein [Chitinophaga varians]|uniref:DUF2695 domain-containing protein n=1 Tax=Chitinophaga varians TaxID=2202339 RepID=UPI00165FE575|nr:DUF2695 domain-containing protein [Chitinophaga varians]MBC9910092.1 DUF2695 domain-containing protein [Chitinophaga varians]
MPSKAGKERRKQLLAPLQQEAAAAFEKGLPMSREQFHQLFDHLDEALGAHGCDHTPGWTLRYLAAERVEQSEVVMAWLAEHGGHCDCEILANVEELFE